MKMPNGKGMIQIARERLVEAVNRLGVVRRNGRSRKVGLALVLMVLTEGQREERGRDVRVGLREPAGSVGRTRRRVERLGVLSGRKILKIRYYLSADEVWVKRYMLQ
jgi:hypothetical protein